MVVVVVITNHYTLTAIMQDTATTFTDNIRISAPFHPGLLRAVMLVDALHVATKYESHNSQELVTSYLSQPASS